MPIVVVIIIAAIVGAFAIKKAAQSLYQKTGVNTLKRLNKFVWYVEAVALIMSFSLDSPVVFFLLLIAFSAIQFLLCKQAGIAGGIIMGLLHGIGGAFFAMLNVMIFLLNLCSMFMGWGGAIRGIGGAFTVDETSNEIDKINETIAESVRMQEEAEAEKRQKQQEAADAYAQRLGFRDANDAERAGFNTGRPQD